MVEYVKPATIVEHVAPVPAVTYEDEVEEFNLLMRYVTLAPAVTCMAPAPVAANLDPVTAPVVEAGPVVVQPAHVVEYTTLAPAVTCLAPAPVAEYVDPAPAATNAAPASWDELEARLLALTPEEQRQVLKMI